LSILNPTLHVDVVSPINTSMYGNSIDYKLLWICTWFEGVIIHIQGFQARMSSKSFAGQEEKIVKGFIG